MLVLEDVARSPQWKTEPRTRPWQEIVAEMIYTADPRRLGKLAEELSRALAEQDPTILERIKPRP